MRPKIEVTDIDCPKCGAKLRQKLEYEATLSGGDWVAGTPFCPRGHRLVFMLDGSVHAH